MRIHFADNAGKLVAGVLLAWDLGKLLNSRKERAALMNEQQPAVAMGFDQPSCVVISSFLALFLILFLGIDVFRWQQNARPAPAGAASDAPPGPWQRH